MWFSTVQSEVTNLFPVAVWSSGIVLAIYGRYRYGRGFSFGILLLGGSLLVLWNLVITPHQLMNPDPSVPQMVGGGGVRMTRATGLFWTANVLGSWLVLFMPLLLLSGAQRLRDRRIGSAIWYLSLTLGSFLVLLRNLSRLSVLGGALVLFLGAAVILMGRWRQFRVRILARSALAALIPTALIWIIISNAGTGADYVRLVQAKIHQSRDAASFRLSLQAAALREVPRHILVGTGYGRSRDVIPSVGELTGRLSPRLRQRYQAAAAENYAPHQMPLNMALEAGLVSALCFFAVVVTTLLRYARGLPRWDLTTHALAISIIAWLFLGLGYNVVYTQAAWPPALLLLGALRGTLCSPRSIVTVQESPAD